MAENRSCAVCDQFGVRETQTEDAAGSVFCGDHKGAKRTAAKLIRQIGFNPVDLGKLSAARYVEPFSLLLAEIAYNGSSGPQLAYRFTSLA